MLLGATVRHRHAARGEHGQLTVSRHTPTKRAGLGGILAFLKRYLTLLGCVLVSPPGQMLQLAHQSGDCRVVPGRLR